MSEDRKAEVDAALEASVEEQARVKEAAKLEGSDSVRSEVDASGRKLNVVENTEEHDERSWDAEYGEPYPPAVEFSERVEELAHEIFGEDNFGYTMYVASPLPCGEWDDGGSVMSSRKNPSLSDNQLMNVVLADIAVSVMMGREHPGILIQLLMGGDEMMEKMLEQYRAERGNGRGESDG